MYHKKPDEPKTSLNDWINQNKFDHVDADEETHSSFSIKDQIEAQPKKRKRGRPRKNTVDISGKLNETAKKIENALKDVSDNLTKKIDSAKLPDLSKLPQFEKNEPFKNDSSVDTHEEKKDGWKIKIDIPKEIDKMVKNKELIEKLTSEREEVNEREIKIADILIDGDAEKVEISETQRSLLKIQREAYLTVYRVLGLRIDDLKK